MVPILFLGRRGSSGSDFIQFRKMYDPSLKGDISSGDLEENLKDLRLRVSQVAIRRTKDILDLPEKTYVDVEVELAPRQREIYDQAREELYYEVEDIDDNVVRKEIDNYLVKLLRLTQIASNPALILNDYYETPSKFAKLDDLVRDITANGEKAIVWSSFRQNIRSLRNRYQHLGALMLFGDIPIEERNITVRKFMNNPDNQNPCCKPGGCKRRTNVNLVKQRDLPR